MPVVHMARCFVYRYVSKARAVASLPIRGSKIDVRDRYKLPFRKEGHLLTTAYSGGRRAYSSFLYGPFNHERNV